MYIVYSIIYSISDFKHKVRISTVGISSVVNIALLSETLYSIYWYNNLTGNRETQVRLPLGMFKYFFEYTSLRTTTYLRGPLSKIHPSVFGRKNKFSSYFVYELDFGQY